MNRAKTPELLAPAGDLERLRTALAYGADAIYLGGSGLDLRARGKGLSWAEVQTALELAGSHGARLYFCLNILAQEPHLARIEEALERLSQLSVHGLIVADPGVVRLAQRYLPQVPLHLSTQANTSNSSSLSFWADQGVTRVNLARELSCQSLRQVRQKTPELELESFVHGAQCLAVSGRCLLSAFLNSRSANLGHCTHPCRFAYRPLALEEAKRRNQVCWEIEQDDVFSRVLAPEDLCLVPYLAWFVRLGWDSLKIEGRAKTCSYVGQVIDVYRTALDDLSQGRFRRQLYLRELANTASRDLGTGFFLPGSRRALLSRPGWQRAPILARIDRQISPGAWEISCRYRFGLSEQVEIVKPGLSRPALGPFGLERRDGRKVQTLHPGLKAILRSESPMLGQDLLLRRRL